MGFLIRAYKEVTRDMEVTVTFTSVNGAVPRPTASLAPCMLLNSTSPNQSGFIHIDYWDNLWHMLTSKLQLLPKDSLLHFPDQNHTRNLLKM